MVWRLKVSSKADEDELELRDSLMLCRIRD